MRVAVIKKRVNFLVFHVEGGVWVTSHLKSIDNMREPDDLRTSTLEKSSTPKKFRWEIVDRRPWKESKAGVIGDKDQVKTIPWTFPNRKGANHGMDPRVIVYPTRLAEFYKQRCDPSTRTLDAKYTFYEEIEL
jgi:hypothetical protein